MCPQSEDPPSLPACCDLRSDHFVPFLRTKKHRDSSVSLCSTGLVGGVPDPETLAFPQVFIVLLSGLGRGQISEETLVFLPDPLQKQNENILQTVKHPPNTSDPSKRFALRKRNNFALLTEI